MYKASIILADPPWQYAQFSEKKNGAAKAHFNGMSTDELCNLPIKNITDTNCALFLWITGPKIVEGCHTAIFEAWGFRPVSLAFTWIKTKQDGNARMGIGFYTRSNSELCLLGIKGKMKVKSHKVMQTIISPVIKPHSSKPPIVRDKIIELFGDLPRVELFARPPIVDGWTMIGNEINGKDIRDALKDLSQ
jgi:N6-adenosine-specific RNA methylase IME4